MNIVEAQREIRMRYVGGFYGQLVSGVIWPASAAVAVWASPAAAIWTLGIGGWFTGVVLLVFAGIGRAVAVHEPRHQTD